MSFAYLGPYSDWVAAARAQTTLRPTVQPGPELRTRIREAIGFARTTTLPSDVRTEHTWSADGVRGEEVSWSVGYGPRTHAFVLQPEASTGPLPGVLALHDHGGFKYFGKEKIADGPDAPTPEIVAFRAKSYGGRAFANPLARRGFVVLVPDVFLWGSRRFPLETMHAPPNPDVSEIEHYNLAAREHEHLVSKYCSLLGTTLAGVVAYEDRAALAYLRGRASTVGCIGLSGGGARAALLQATADHLDACAIAGMMTTHDELLDRHLVQHTWMFEPPGLASVCDWPDLAAARAPAPLLVQYNREDPLFSPRGMNDAHARIAAHYRDAGNAAAYSGQFYAGPHKFDCAMQDYAFDWLTAALGAAS